MFVMWQEVVACGGGGCCQMMAPGGTMCEMKAGGEWGEVEIKKEAKERKREEPLHNKQASLPPPASCAHVLQLLVI